MALKNITWAGLFMAGSNFYYGGGYWGMQKKPKIMAKAFDVATCEKGHPRYLFGKTIREGTRMASEDFVPLGDSPKLVISVQLFDLKCPECGAKVFEPTQDGNYGLKFYNRSKLMGEGSYSDEHPVEHAAPQAGDILRDDTAKAGKKT